MLTRRIPEREDEIQSRARDYRLRATGTDYSAATTSGLRAVTTHTQTHTHIWQCELLLAGTMLTR